MEEILKDLIKEKSFVKLLRDLEKEESIYKENKINVEEKRMYITRMKVNQFFN